MKITRYEWLNTERLFNGALAAYRNAFEEINRNAIQRHMMTYEEFAGVMDDRRVQKWVATEESGEICGLGVMTTDLMAVPLISPEYFEYHMPKLYKEERIFYVQFVCVDKSVRSVHTFQLLIAAMLSQIVRAAGCVVMDFCDFNVERLHLPETVLVMQRRYNPLVQMKRADSQGYYMYNHTGEEWVA